MSTCFIMAMVNDFEHIVCFVEGAKSRDLFMFTSNVSRGSPIIVIWVGILQLMKESNKERRNTLRDSVLRPLPTQRFLSQIMFINVTFFPTENQMSKWEFWFSAINGNQTCGLLSHVVKIAEIPGHQAAGKLRGCFTSSIFQRATVYFNGHSKFLLTIHLLLGDLERNCNILMMRFQVT